MEKIGSFFTKLNHIALTICGLIVTSAAYRYGSVTNVMQIPRFYIYGIVTASMILAFASWIVLLVCRKGEFEQC